MYKDALHFPRHMCYERYLRFHYKYMWARSMVQGYYGKGKIFGFFQVLLYLGKLEEQQELVYSTNSSIIVL
jgi:hypothetical protein